MAIREAQQEEGKVEAALADTAAAGSGTALAGRPAAPATQHAAIARPTPLARALADRGLSLFWSLLLVALVPALLSGALFFLVARHGSDPGGALLACLAVAAAAAGAARQQQRSLAQALRQIVERADAMTAKHSAEVPAPERCELAALARSVEAMTTALLNTVERTRESLEAETQNGVDLQRRYALMQLLRNLASVANEGGSLEQALQSSLREIGDYLDWPVGRLVLVIHRKAPELEEVRSHWYAPDAERFAAFIEACAQESVDSHRSNPRSGLIGRAIESSLSHWITDLGRLEEWPPGAAARACGLRTGFVIPIAVAPEVTALVEFFAVHRIEASAEMLELVEAISVELWCTANRCSPEIPNRSGEARLRRLAMVAERTEHAVLLIDANQRVEWVNAGLLKMLGSTPDQCLGREAAQLLFAADPSAMAQCRRFLESAEPVRGFELSTRGTDAPQRWYELEFQALPVPDSGARREGSGGFLLVRDNTPARAAQEALREALDAARQASQLPSQYLAQLCRAVRAPTNGVLAMAKLLLGTKLDQRQRRCVESLCRSGDRLQQTLDEAPAFSMIESDELASPAADYELHVLVDDLVQGLAPRALEKNLQLDYRLSPETPAVVHGDPIRLRQVLLIVLGNAIEFTEQGAVELSVDAVPGDGVPRSGPAATRVRFEVRDTGIGIPPESLARLPPDPLPADFPTSQHFGAAGSGLAMARQLTEMMGGSICAQSRVGQGATFRIELPLQAVPAPAHRHGRVVAPINRRAADVADPPTHQPIVEEPLAMARMDCASADNGGQARVVDRNWAPALTALALAVQPTTRPATAPASDTALDAQVLGQIRAMERNGATGLLQRLVGVYQQSSSALLAAGERALAQGDALALAQCLHTLKSSSASLGALRLARACAQIGSLVRHPSLNDAQSRWADLRAEHDQVLTALRELAPEPVVAGSMAEGN
jgi:signal transduction histidine kinase/HPt (histidine-containing phosphotransfer) domain-containing protein